MKAVVVALAIVMLLSACSDDDKTAATAGKTSSEETLKRDCNDAKWKAQNLGLWYSVCRPPLRW